VIPAALLEIHGPTGSLATKGVSMRRISIVAAAAAATMACSFAFAQASAPMGTERPTTGTPSTGSTTTRAKTKEETLKARKEGELQPAGSTQKGDEAMAKQKSTKTRAQRKAETMEARKKKELVPAGGGSPAPSK